MTLIAVPILVHDTQDALRQAHAAQDAGADLVELRLDVFTDDPDAAVDLLAKCPLPAIVTIRPEWEGGQYDGEETDRVALLERLGTAEHPPAYLDVELAAYQRSANLRQKINLAVDRDDRPRPAHARLILSTHDFQTRPADLTRRLTDMARHDVCRVVKAAWRARSIRDNLEAFELMAAAVKPTIALCMGDAGLMSRVLAKKFGALLTFARLNDNDPGTAEGQPTVDQLKTLYRWDHLGTNTRVFGVIGHPVAHSLSPAVHNAGFSAIGYDGVYLPMPVAPSYEAFKATLASFLDVAPLHLTGLSVTIPHKENLLRFANEVNAHVDDLTRRIGAANTLTRDEAGNLQVTNTDYTAAVESVLSVLPDASLPPQTRVAVLGAGGAARAAVAGFTDAGGHVTVYNRTASKAAELAQAFHADHAPLDQAPAADAQVIINCTSLGMHPHVDDSPLPADAPCLTPGTVVFDTIYNPHQTLLLRHAQAAGCLTVPGRDMFLRQAAAQFTLWTSHAAPLDAMQQALA